MLAQSPSTHDGIYDIFYTDRYHLILPWQNNIPKFKLEVDDSVTQLTCTVCPHRHTIIYMTEPMPFSADVKINSTSVGVSRYPDLAGKIIMSTLVKDEERYIRQWIVFHRRMGVEHFIIYDNSPTPSARMGELLEDLIRDEIVILIHWPYTYRLPGSGISAQTTGQNHSIYAFRRAKYIGLLDVDEYVVTDGADICTTLDKLHAENIGGFELISRVFHNSKGLPEDGYDFLKITECGGWHKFDRQKLFVIPENVSMFSVHMILTGKPKYMVPPEVMHFNHYMFLNKPGRARNPYPCNDDSILKFIPD